MSRYLYSINYLLLQIIFAINRLNIANTTIITAANISIYIYLIRKLTISIVALIKYNI